eukprot:Gb_02674 [translate_table: standard]
MLPRGGLLPRDGAIARPLPLGPQLEEKRGGLSPLREGSSRDLATWRDLEASSLIGGRDPPVKMKGARGVLSPRDDATRHHRGSSPPHAHHKRRMGPRDPIAKTSKGARDGTTWCHHVAPRALPFHKRELDPRGPNSILLKRRTMAPRDTIARPFPVPPYAHSEEKRMEFPPRAGPSSHKANMVTKKKPKCISSLTQRSINRPNTNDKISEASQHGKT